MLPKYVLSKNERNVFGIVYEYIIIVIIIKLII